MEGILVGLLSGTVISFFRWGLETGSVWRQWFYANVLSGGSLVVNGLWFALLLAAALILWLLGRYEPQAGGSGIPQIKGVILGAIRLRWFRVLWVKLVGGILGIGLGLSLGREGPSIQIGAVAAQGMSRLFGRTRMEERYLITAGASAGLAAAFNAPLAGVMFALEELHRNFFRCRPGTGHGSGFDGDHGQSLPFWTGTGFFISASCRTFLCGICGWP